MKLRTQMGVMQRYVGIPSWNTSNLPSRHSRGPNPENKCSTPPRQGEACTAPPVDIQLIAPEGTRRALHTVWRDRARFLLVEKLHSHNKVHCTESVESQGRSFSPFFVEARGRRGVGDGICGVLNHVLSPQVQSVVITDMAWHGMDSLC